MKYFFLITFFVFQAHADETVFQDFQKNNEEVQFESQPAPRSPASVGDANSITSADLTDEFSIHRQDPLQVLDMIPEGEESISRAWMEHKVDQELNSVSE